MNVKFHLYQDKRGLFTGFRVESVKPPHEAELHLDGAEVVGAAFVLKKIVVVLGLVDLVLGVEVAEAHLGVKRQAARHGEHESVGEPGEETLALVACATAFEVKLSSAGRQPHVVAVPRLVGVKPVATLGCEVHYLIVFVATVVFPPRHIGLSGERPAVVDSPFKLHVGHEQGIVDEIGLQCEVLCLGLFGGCGGDACGFMLRRALGG